MLYVERYFEVQVAKIQVGPGDWPMSGRLPAHVGPPVAQWPPGWSDIPQRKIPVVVTVISSKFSLPHLLFCPHNFPSMLLLGSRVLGLAL
ncbi:hypothetical protein GB937_005921 [Aspergillus fischeri]|nr:hypothetical protein GB937_005921 [Aspergillus fischeri]